MAQGYCLARARYSSLTFQHGGWSLANRAGLESWVSGREEGWKSLHKF